MKNPRVPLLPLARSSAQAELLALLFLRPGEEINLTEAARISRSGLKTIHSEANLLVASGLAIDRRRGNMRLLKADTSSPLAGPITELLMLAYGPLVILTDVFGAVAEISKAFIHGPWAARYRGAPGPVPLEIEVLLVSGAPGEVIAATVETAQQRLKRKIKVRRVQPSVWNAPDRLDPFVAAVRRRPMVELPLPPPRKEPAPEPPKSVRSR